MKKTLLLFLIIITLIGVSGCMNENSKVSLAEDYREDILSYLENKYNSSFEVKKINRNVMAGEPDTVVALCVSNEYPNETFDVIYYLPEDDVYGSEEVVSLLQESGTYDESKLKKNENGTEAFFKDNYCNVVMQNKFTDSIDLPEGVALTTYIETINYYPSEDDLSLTLEQFLHNDNYSIACYNYVFVNTESLCDESEIIGRICNSNIKNQYINIIMTSKTNEECLKIYYDNYDFPYEVFEDDSDTVKIDVHSYKYGER